MLLRHLLIVPSSWLPSCTLASFQWQVYASRIQSRISRFSPSAHHKVSSLPVSQLCSPFGVEPLDFHYQDFSRTIAQLFSRTS